MNLTVQTRDEQLSRMVKPTVTTTERLEIYDGDWLIVCAGFEDRAVGILQSAVASQSSFMVLLVNYEPFFPENRADAIRGICIPRQIPVIDVTYDRQNPAGFGGIVLEQLSTCQGRIFIDVSAMSRLLIVQLLVALGTRPDGFSNCFVAYAEAAEYPPSRNEAEAELLKSKSDPTFSVLFLSSGVFEITLIPELSSLAPSGVQTRLIAFPTFDAHQLTALRAEIQPSRFSFIEGWPPHPQNAWRQQIVSEVNCLDQIQGAEHVTTSTLDYRETLDALLSIYATHSVHERLLVSPTGSKMQTVAVGLFRAFIEDVQIVYPTPFSFLKPAAYTHGIGPLHVLPLGSFRL